MTFNSDCGWSEMGKKDEQQKQKEKDSSRVEALFHLLNKQAPLTFKQDNFCNNACVERFLKAKGGSVKKAAKQLRACLSWRESVGIEYLIADEFSVELAQGVAYVAGHDQESRPVIIFRIKQDYQKFNWQKRFIRLVVFTLEVAIQSMGRNVEQLVLVFDASFFRSASAFMSVLLATMKIVAKYYPGRLHKAFVIDPPSLFSCLWKGVRPFVELSLITMVVSSPWWLKEFTSASPVANAPHGNVNAIMTSFFPTSPLQQKAQMMDPTSINSSKKECHVNKCRESFLPYLKLYRQSYDEMTYRSKMRPPLGGILSIVSAQLEHHIYRIH